MTVVVIWSRALLQSHHKNCSNMLVHHSGTYTFRFLIRSIFSIYANGIFFFSFDYALKLNTGFITSIISAESLMTSMISSIGLYAIGDSSIVSSLMLVE